MAADGACISANVARLRLDRGLTQEEVAVQAGLSRLALERIERGSVVPRASTPNTLAKALMALVGELVTPVRPPPASGSGPRRKCVRGGTIQRYRARPGYRRASSTQGG